MKKSLKLTLVLISLCAVLTGCRLQTVEPQPSLSSAAVAAGPAVIATSARGAQAASQISQTRELVMTDTQLLKNLGDFALSVMAPGVPNQNTDITCIDGGAFQYSGTEANGSYSLTLKFNGCRDKGYQYVGSYTASGTPSNFTVALGGADTFNIFNFNTSYTVLLAYLKTNLTFTMVGSGTSSDASYLITSNGSIKTFDYFLLDTFTMSFTNLKSAYTLATNTITGDQTVSVLANGQFSESWGGSASAVYLVLNDFQVDKVRLYNAILGTFYAEDVSINGTVTFNIRPVAFGFGGKFTVTTQTPVRTVYTPSSHTTQGALSINTTAAVQYNTGGDVVVTVTGDTPSNYTKEYELMKIGDFSAMEQDKPPLIPPPGPGGSPVPGGSSMALTLTWTGPAPTFASVSDMDLHVKYYNITAPDPATAETWHIDWHKGTNCTAPMGLDFSKAGIDIDGDGMCDVGLDFDDVDGFGPEHITALKIPEGYYVVSVDSFSLHGDTAAALYLSLNIGDSIFGPYNSSLDVDDGETAIAGAWMRVADIRVDANGTVTVLPPDTTLTPWH